MVKGLNAGDFTNEFATKTVTYRGVTYVVHELSMAAYDKTVELATNKNDEGVSEFDGNAHTKILTAKCVKVNGKPVDADELYARGARLVRALQRAVQTLHWDPEPEEEPVVSEGEAQAEAKA